MNEQTLKGFIENIAKDPLTPEQWLQIEESKQSFIKDRLREILQQKKKLEYEEQRLSEGRFVKRREGRGTGSRSAEYYANMTPEERKERTRAATEAAKRKRLEQQQGQEQQQEDPTPTPEQYVTRDPETGEPIEEEDNYEDTI